MIRTKWFSNLLYPGPHIQILNIFMCPLKRNPFLYIGAILFLVMNGQVIVRTRRQFFALEGVTTRLRTTDLCGYHIIL